MFERMFAQIADEALLGAIEQAAVEEAQAGARRLAAIAELTHRTVDDDDERSRWSFDLWAATSVDIGAALSIGQRRASAQMRIAMALRDRLPRVAALFCAGRIDARVISQLTWRTHLIDDEQVLAIIDSELADHAASWGALSKDKLIAAVNAVIERYDPDTVRLTAIALRERDFCIGAHEDGAETTSVWGRLMAADGIAAERRILAMIDGVCANDPRSIGQRRSEAAGALLNGRTHLPCRCGSPDCPKADTPAPQSNIVVHVIVDKTALDAASAHAAAEAKGADAKKSAAVTNAAASTVEPAAAEPAAAESDAVDEPAADTDLATDCEPAPLKDIGLALLPGLTVMPTAALADAIRGGAKVAPLWLPGPDPEPHYRPSARLAQFVRLRDMFCRFPGCDVPAERCDIDHSEPWPYGPTHPSNMNCKCRTHHLGKTFAEGWREVQSPDGTITFTAPDGRTYTTRPGCALFFPTFPAATADLPLPPPIPPPNPQRIAKMPIRRRLRSADDAARIKAERAHNKQVRAAADDANRAARDPGPSDHTPGRDDPPF
ncbi:HNH endonuclease signature motif containing protein [Mycolicibacterium psychrotolerans]|uniref:HNH endonuclease n=1 Tax=Mycolicibacterium psychrotolerans TaxID=216929 RepID=A0A7I7ML10_9MYCO|nr:HNH endonuclease signature motif containing protein [Mycolicibacterium psychrotolerans]BBX71929.1 HNH endonuclease [Mycolicibacterium psychrotolerans]